MMRRWMGRAAASVGLTAAAACFPASDLTYANRQTFLAPQQDSLEQLALDLRTFERIRSMSDGQRHFKLLNGELVAYDSAEVDTAPRSGFVPTYPLATVLARDHIEPEAYAAFRDRLVRTGYIQVEVNPTYTAFMRDGFIDNANGFLWVLPDAEPPRIQSSLFTEQIVLIDSIGDGWYYFAID